MVLPTAVPRMAMALGMLLCSSREPPLSGGRSRLSNYRVLLMLMRQKRLLKIPSLFCALIVNLGEIFFTLRNATIHGYKDQEVAAKEEAQDFISYLAKTPLLAGLLQAGVLILVLIIAQNRRFGRPLTLSAPVIDNTEAYIQALAGVLQKAESGEFVVEVVGKEEQLQLQKALGLGTVLVEHPILVKAWIEQTQRPASELEQVLRIQAKKRRLSDQELLNWLGQWQSIRSHIPS
jgi:hypothetical protein